MSKNIKNSPLKIISGTIQALGAYDWGGKRRKARETAEEEYGTMKERFMGLDTSNLYADVTNPYANMENVYEDLTINQQQAQFERQMAQQSQANVMQGLRGAAGGSGVAGLAQALSNQGAMQAQRASASIGQQEAANQKLAAQQAGQLQSMERQGAWKADMTRRAGQEQSRTLEKDKVNTLFTMSTNRLGTAMEQEELAKERMWKGIGNIFNPFGG